MDLQAKTHDLSLRVPVESFTEIGHIATRYNQVMDALQTNHQQNVESLEELYAITATIVAALENRQFSPTDFDSFAARSDELGILARVLQQIVEIINNQHQELGVMEQKLKISTHKQQNLIIDIPPSMVDHIQSINDLDDLHQLLQQAITASSLDEFFFS